MKASGFLTGFTGLLLLMGLGHGLAQKPYYKPNQNNWQTPQPQGKPKRTVFLVGDAGKATKGDAVMALLQQQAKACKGKPTVLFLGDNIYPKGLPNEYEKGYAKAKAHLDAQIEAVKKGKAEAVFLPGNHDWHGGAKDGRRQLENQERYLQDQLGKNTLLPQEGCEGPELVDISDNVALIVFDSQWLLNYFYKDAFGQRACHCDNESGFLNNLQDALEQNRHKHLIVAAHHPLYSVGNHGGRFAVAQSLFPLTELHPALVLPLPGFLHTGYRKLFGLPQDLNSHQYKTVANKLKALLQQYPNVVYASGHEHNLQYVQHDSLHHIISGSGSKVAHVAHSTRTDFAYAHLGFSRLDYYADGSCWLSMYAAGQSDPLVYRKQLYKHGPSPAVANTAPNYADSSMVMNPSNRYKAGKLKRFFFGHTYRHAWEQPVRVPYFDIGAAKGGLAVTKRGGGMATRSYRLQDKQGHEYVLRTLEKYADRNLPSYILNTIAVDAVQDQISASFPYAAIMVPPLAHAAGVYHANPKVVYVPNDTRLGIYQNEMAGKLFLFEERADGNCEDIDTYGNSPKVIATNDAIAQLKKDQDWVVDKEAFLCARLFDLFINDWDRHEDQWRIATFQEGKRVVLRPIPRDRDQAFFKVDGLFPTIASQPWILPKMQGFEADSKYIEGLLYNAKYFDRTFLNQADLNDWLAVANRLQAQLTDSVIDLSVAQMPNELRQKYGPEFAAKLRSRRDKLPQFAQRSYRFLAKTVDVVGTNHEELFRIRRISDQETEVTVFNSKKNGKKKGKQLYKRVFKTSETKEIRIYGLDGDDYFKVTGFVNKGIRLRIVGGGGHDRIIDRSHVKGISKKTLVYDKANDDPDEVYAHGPGYRPNTYMELGDESKDLTSKEYAVNEYDRTAFKYDKGMPAAFMGFNQDDGLFIGGGLQRISHGFRKEPFAAKQQLMANYAWLTGAFNFKYGGEFNQSVGSWDLLLDAHMGTPSYGLNFFGWGNESENTAADEAYNRIRIQRNRAAVSLRKRQGEQQWLRIGLSREMVQLSDRPDRVLGQRAGTQAYGQLVKRKSFLGLEATYLLDTRDHKMLPHKGVYWHNQARWCFGLAEAKTHSSLNTDLYLYVPAKQLLVFAFRFGGGINVGEYDFYNAQTLGGRSNLRGFRRTRFVGDKSLFQSTEVRLKLFGFRNYLFSGQLGVFGFHDIGRVWYAGEDSRKWHSGYGGGIWLAPFNRFVLRTSLNRSAEGAMLEVRAGYFF